MIGPLGLQCCGHPAEVTEKFEALNILWVTFIHSQSCSIYKLSKLALAKISRFLSACDRELWKALEDEDRGDRVDAVVIRIVLGRFLALYSN